MIVKERSLFWAVASLYSFPGFATLLRVRVDGGVRGRVREYRRMGCGVGGGFREVA